eukprot:CAMPEP_0168858792 /NCGR_PEP_ID=MMETSP0727-20121128/16476_1 /TAXON_ID=265536 /ORGANISM="Amphiprora sp., Strain CCMP467" /LENGTH=154 /DNA_ID=CAMNT_0008913559 /DNA_START=19 /DNA_END=479 /DNA_ORIENTATION=+
MILSSRNDKSFLSSRNTKIRGLLVSPVGGGIVRRRTLPTAVVEFVWKSSGVLFKSDSRFLWPSASAFHSHIQVAIDVGGHEVGPTTVISKSKHNALGMAQDVQIHKRVVVMRCLVLRPFPGPLRQKVMAAIQMQMGHLGGSGIGGIAVVVVVVV